MDNIKGLNTERLMNELKTLASDVQDLVRATASVVTDKATEARTRVETSLKNAQGKINEVQENVKDKSAAAAKVAHDYVQENPWTAVSIGISAGFFLGVGFAAGAFLRRRD